MFQNIRKSWRLKGRVDDLSETLEATETRLDRYIRKAEEDLELLALEVKRLRGRVTGGIRNAEPDGEQVDWQVIDEQIRKGTYQP